MSRDAGRTAGWVAAACLLTLATLVGCETGGATIDRGTPPPESASPDTTQSASVPAHPNVPGILHLILSPSGAGNYYGWQFQVLEAATNRGFLSFQSPIMDEGQSLRAELWPDRYRVRIFLLGDVEFDQWVEVAAGRSTVVYVDISFLSNSIEVLTGPEAAASVAEVGQPNHRVRTDQAYEPLTVTLRPGWTGRWDGPRRGSEPVGQGRLQIFEDGEEIAVFSPAEVEDGHFRGTPFFEDRRKVEGEPGPDYAYAEGTVTTWPDGRRFQGRYDGLDAREGTLTYPDGRAWTGEVERGQPFGVGRATLADGTAIEGVTGLDPSAYDGVYECVTPQGTATQCHYLEGESMTAAAYEKEMAAREEAQLAEQLEMAASAPPPAPAAAPAPKPAIDGCTQVEGRFVADGGLSRLELDGAGKGHMWQQTYGGSAVYTFDIDFSYRGSRSGMRFDYGPGIYKDASGKVLKRMSIPGGDADCAYDGTTLVINGKPYARG